MPGRLLMPTKPASRETGKTMGMYKLTFPGSLATQESRVGSKTSYGFRKAFMGHRIHNGECRDLAQQPMSAKTSTASCSLEAPEMENFAAISEDDELRSKESVFTASSASTRNGNAISDDDSSPMGFASRAKTRNSNTISDDDSSRMEFTSRACTRNRNTISDDDSSRMEFTSRASASRNCNATSDDDSSRMEFASRASALASNTTSDDDSLLREFARRTSTCAGDLAAQSMRHSTACCSDLAFRRELRKRLHVEPAVDENGLRRDSTSSFTMGHSFRRELEKEDRVESLALWEETDHRTQRTSIRNIAAQNAAPHSWHAGDMAASRRSTRNNVLDTILRKKKSSFFNGFFSGLTFSSSRKPRKLLG